MINSINRLNNLNRINSSSYKAGGGILPASLRDKFLFLWTGGHTEYTLKNSLGSGAINVTGKGVQKNYLEHFEDSDTYGLLYNWYALSDPKGIAPVGYHPPTKAEWETLFTYLGGYSVFPGKIKEAGTEHWQDPNIGTNESGFTLLPAGFRSSIIIEGGMLSFEGIGQSATLVAFDEASATFTYWWRIVSGLDSIAAYGNSAPKNEGNPIRCIRDTIDGWSEGELITDYDGNIYTSIQIGTQVWLVENLRTTHFRDGTLIPEITDDSDWRDLTTPGLCAYNNDWKYVDHSLYRLSIPNDPAFIAADTDNFWHLIIKGNTVIYSKTTEELITSNTLRTFIKYSDFAPYNIYAIGILKEGEVITDEEKVILNRYFKLWAEYWGEFMDSGYMKDNRIGNE